METMGDTVVEVPAWAIRSIEGAAICRPHKLDRLFLRRLGGVASAVATDGHRLHAVSWRSDGSDVMVAAPWGLVTWAFDQDGWDRPQRIGPRQIVGNVEWSSQWVVSSVADSVFDKMADRSESGDSQRFEIGSMRRVTQALQTARTKTLVVGMLDGELVIGASAGGDWEVLRSGERLPDRPKLKSVTYFDTKYFWDLTAKLRRRAEAAVELGRTSTSPIRLTVLGAEEIGPEANGAEAVEIVRVLMPMRAPEAE